MNKQIAFIFIALIMVMPIIYAETVSDSIQQQINANSANAQNLQVSTEDGSKALDYLLANNPQFRTAFYTVIVLLIVVALLSLVDLVLRGFAMWRAAQNKSKVWFWVLLIVNSLCILPIIYLLISKKHEKSKKK